MQKKKLSTMLWNISKASKQKLSSLVTSRLLKSDLLLTFYLSVLLHLCLKVKLHLQKTQKCTIHSGYKSRHKREYECRTFMNVQKEKKKGWKFFLSSPSLLEWRMKTFLGSVDVFSFSSRAFFPSNFCSSPSLSSLLARAQAAAHLWKRNE